MNTTIESRLWLAVHLLYPNSSQAFDVYQAIVQQSESALTKNDRLFVFGKLVAAFDKITAISSSLSFYEFEFDQIDQWKLIYKGSQKIQLIIFIGMLIFEIEMKDIAANVKLSEEKAQFLFHQMFKKLVQNGSKVKQNDQLRYKKQNDLKISYLFTYENLIEYCLGRLSEAEEQKVEKGLELYPILQVTRDEYFKVIRQIQNLKVQRANSVTTKTKLALVKTKVSDNENANKAENTDQSENENKSTLTYANKKVIASALATFALVTFILIRFGGVGEDFFGKERSIVIQEVEKKTSSLEPQSDIALESLPKQTEIEKVENPETVVAAAEPEVKAEAPAVVRDESKPVDTQVADNKKEDVAKNKSGVPQGGLFRGVIKVKKLAESNKKILAKLSELGAAKAGEVELGWIKSKNTAYYHFTLPEDNIDAAKDYLKQFGALKIKFEAHPRLIPAGQKRFIIEVKE